MPAINVPDDVYTELLARLEPGESFASLLRRVLMIAPASTTPRRVTRKPSREIFGMDPRVMPAVTDLAATSIDDAFRIKLGLPRLLRDPYGATLGPLTGTYTKTGAATVSQEVFDTMDSWAHGQHLSLSKAIRVLFGFAPSGVS